MATNSRPGVGRTARRALAGTLSASPRLAILATSREPLGLHAERRYPVAPLAVTSPQASDSPETLAGVAAVALFCERARARDPDFRLNAANAAAGRLFRWPWPRHHAVPPPRSVPVIHSHPRNPQGPFRARMAG